MLIEPIKKLSYVSLLGSLSTVAFSNSLFEISSSVFLGLWLLALCVERRFSVFSGVWVWFLAAYAAVNIFSVVQASFSHDSLKGAFRVVRWVLLTIAVTDTIDTKEKFSYAMDAVLATVIFIVVDGLVQGATGVEILRGRSLTAFYGPTGRVTGPFPHANDFSAYLCLSVFAFVGAIGWAVSFRRRKQAAVFLLGLVLVMICLVLTYARGAWIAVLTALLLMAVLRRSAWPILIIFVFLSGAYLQSPFLFKNRIESLSRAWDGTVRERRLLWTESLQMIQERPLFGFGVNTYSTNVGRFKDLSQPTDRQYAHNGYLHIAAETGLIGLAAFLAVVFFFLVSCGRLFFARPPDTPILFAGQGIWLGLVAFLFQSATDTTLQSLLLAGMFWIWAGLGWSAYRLSRVPS